MDDLINEYAKKVGMEEFLDKEPSNLSGGQKQRVAIAGILVMHPDIIIFDEATSMLDPKGKREIKELTTKMREINPDITIISITHDIEEALLADNVVILQNGRVILHEEAKDAFKDEKKVIELGLDLPFNYKLHNSLKELGIELEDNDMEAMVNSLCV
jgi:energy-coupling factor transport system ATP-binding protein